MKKIIGFTDCLENDTNTSELSENTPAVTREPFKCIVKIRFPNIAKEYSYYNDSFYLEEGDTVFVSGKLYGVPGIVTDVSRRFRINTADYKKVIARPNTDIKGTFIPVRDKMVSFDTDFTADDFAQMVIAPPNPDSEEQPGEIISGEGWSVALDGFENSLDVEKSKLEKALNCCIDGKVIFFSLKGNEGRAIIKGKRWYTVEFNFDGETVDNLFCDCSYHDFSICKHELATLITLSVLSSQPQLEGKNSFTAIDKKYFFENIMTDKGEIKL